ncbi:LysR family transcriptional regulator [bacterium BFN5]|nr:LysR family transcriptional regulator [bacterium BFN5]QJW47802.1 LysR family transcriptional regulator [bacterium BFN5]
MEVRHIKSFLFVAETGSFTRAAEQLGYVQSSVSAHVHALETELGVKLFCRDAGKSAMLTAAGKLLLPMAKELIAISDKIVTGLSEPETLRVATVESLSNSRLKTFFQRYHTMHPEINLIFQYGSCAQNLMAVREGKVDLAILLDKNIMDADVKVQFSCPEPIRFFSSPEHLLANKISVDISDLEGLEVILTERGCSYHDAFIAFLRENSLKLSRMVEVNSIATIIEFVRTSQGVTLLPEIAVREEVNGGKLIPINWIGPQFDMFTQIVSKKEKDLKHSAQLFLKMASQIIS